MSSPQDVLGEEIQVCWENLRSALALPIPGVLTTKCKGLARHLESVITCKQRLDKNALSIRLGMLCGFWTVNPGDYS